MFGKKEDKQPWLGLYISPDLMVLSETDLDGGRLAVKQIVRIPIPAKEGAPTTARVGTLNTELLSDTARFVELLKPVLSEGSWSSKRLVVTLSPHFALSRYFVMPAVDRRFWKQSVPLEAKKYIPFAFSDLRYDFQVFPMAATEKGARMGVLFALSPIKNIDSITAIAQALGLEAAAVELASFSALRVWKGMPGGLPGGAAATVQVHFDDHSAYLIMHEHGVPLITREVHWTGDNLDRRRLDLAGSVDFARKQLGVKDVKAVVTGSQELDKWVAGVGEDLAMQVDPLDVKEAAGLPAVEWQVLSAVGASLRPLGASKVLVDVSQAYVKLFEDARVVRALTIGVSVIGGLLLALTLVYQARVIAAMSQLSSLRRKTMMIPAFQGRAADEIEQSMNQLRSEAGYYAPHMDQRLYVTNWLTQISEALPPSVWFKALNYSSPITVESSSGRSLSIDGLSYGRDRGEDLQFARQYLDTLKADKVFKEVFPECTPSFESGAASGGGSTEGEEHMRSPFKFNCSSKR